LIRFCTSVKYNNFKVFVYYMFLHFILTQQADAEMPKEYLRYSMLPDFLKYVYSRVEEISKKAGGSWWSIVLMRFVIS